MIFGAFELELNSRVSHGRCALWIRDPESARREFCVFCRKKNPLSFRKIGNPGVDISNPTHVLPMSRSGQTFRNNWRRFCCGWPPISCHVTAKTALMSTHSGAAFLQLLDGHGKQDPFSTRFFFIRSVLVLARTEPTLVVHHAWARACPTRKSRGFGASPTGKRSLVAEFLQTGDAVFERGRKLGFAVRF